MSLSSTDNELSVWANQFELNLPYNLLLIRSIFK